MSIDERANAGIGFAFQQPPAFKGMTVRRLFEPGGRYKAAGACELPFAEQRRALRQGISGQGGGCDPFRRRKKRVEIATVMAKDHKVSIFDEPEAGIDLWSFLCW